MLTEIIPGRRYLRRDGVEVEAVDCPTHLSYQGGTVITVRIVAAPRTADLEHDNDGGYRWRKNGPRPPEAFSGWGDEMFAGELPRKKTAGKPDNISDMDLIECTSHPEFERKETQLELF